MLTIWLAWIQCLNGCARVGVLTTYNIDTVPERVRVSGYAYHLAGMDTALERERSAYHLAGMDTVLGW